jgi:hypothetical protein
MNNPITRWFAHQKRFCSPSMETLVKIHPPRFAQPPKAKQADSDDEHQTEINTD